MKARDIVKGWPRGRSTASPIPTWRIVRDYGQSALYWVFRYGDSFDGLEAAIRELQADIAYHEGQRKMIDNWLFSDFVHDPSYLAISRFVTTGGKVSLIAHRSETNCSC